MIFSTYTGFIGMQLCHKSNKICTGLESDFFKWTSAHIHPDTSCLLGKDDSIIKLGFEILSTWLRGFPGGACGKEPTCNAEDPVSIPGSRRSPGEGNDYLLQYSCLGVPMDRRVWWATVHGIAKSQTQLRDEPLRCMLLGLESQIHHLDQFGDLWQFTCSL